MENTRGTVIGSVGYTARLFQPSGTEFESIIVYGRADAVAWATAQKSIVIAESHPAVIQRYRLDQPWILDIHGCTVAI